MTKHRFNTFIYYTLLVLVGVGMHLLVDAPVLISVLELTVIVVSAVPVFMHPPARLERLSRTNQEHHPDDCKRHDYPHT